MTILCTPKCFHDYFQKYPDIMDEYKFEITPWIYMNMADPDWTAERCDQTIYIVDGEKEDILSFRDQYFPVKS